MAIFCKDPEFSTTRMLTVSTPPDSGTLSVKPLGGLRFAGYEKAGSPERPLISVIIAVLNRSAALEHAIRSVLYQQYENIELIIIDGGSIDGSLEIIQKYNDCIDYWVSEPDGGIYYALNKGIEASKGDWLYFLGSDDVMLNCLHTLAACFTDPYCVYYGDVYYPTPHKLFGGEFSTYRLMNCQIPHQATFYPKNLFKKHRYNTDYISAADYVFNIECYNDTEFTYKFVPILVAVYEDTLGFSTLDRDSKFKEEKNMLLKKYFSKSAYRNYTLRTYVKNIDRYFLRKLLKMLKRLVT